MYKENLVNLILKSVGIAMWIAVLVTNIIGEISV